MLIKEAIKITNGPSATRITTDDCGYERGAVLGECKHTVLIVEWNNGLKVDFGPRIGIEIGFLCKALGMNDDHNHISYFNSE